MPPPPHLLSLHTHPGSGFGFYYPAILLKVMMPWALWASYWLESSAVKPGDLCPWDGPPKKIARPSIHPSISRQARVSIYHQVMSI